VVAEPSGQSETADHQRRIADGPCPFARRAGVRGVRSQGRSRRTPEAIVRFLMARCR